MRLLLASPQRRCLASERSKRKEEEEEEEKRGLMMRRSLAQVAFLPSALSAGSSEVCTQMAWVPFLFLPINFFLSHIPRLAIAFKTGGGGLLESSSSSFFPLSSHFPSRSQKAIGWGERTAAAAFNGAWPWWCTKRVKNNIAPLTLPHFLVQNIRLVPTPAECAVQYVFGDTTNGQTIPARFSSSSSSSQNSVANRFLSSPDTGRGLGCWELVDITSVHLPNPMLPKKCCSKLLPVQCPRRKDERKRRDVRRD